MITREFYIEETTFSLCILCVLIKLRIIKMVFLGYFFFYFLLTEKKNGFAYTDTHSYHGKKQQQQQQHRKKEERLVRFLLMQCLHHIFLPYTLLESFPRFNR